MDNDKLDELERAICFADGTPLDCDYPLYVSGKSPRLTVTASNIRDLITAARRPAHVPDVGNMIGRPALADREAVARIIEPKAWEIAGALHRYRDWHEVQQVAFTKADDILALFALSPAQAETDADERCPLCGWREKHCEMPDCATLSAAPKVTT